MAQYFSSWLSLLSLLFVTVIVQSSPTQLLRQTGRNWTPVKSSQLVALPFQSTLSRKTTQPKFQQRIKSFNQTLPSWIGRFRSRSPNKSGTIKYPLALSSRVESECKGFDNLLADIGVISYGLGFIGTLIGFFTMLTSFVTQIQTVLSTYLVGVPSSLLTLNNFFGNPSAVPTMLANAIALFGLIDTFVNLTFATNVNGLVNITDIFGAIISFSSLYLGAGSTFPNVVKYVAKELLGADLETIFANYGCS